MWWRCCSYTVVCATLKSWLLSDKKICSGREKHCESVSLSPDQWIIHLFPHQHIWVFSQRFALPSINRKSIFLSSNPTPGVLINRPNGTDVYKGVPKDYTGEVITSVQMFILECSTALCCWISALQSSQHSVIVWRENPSDDFWLAVFLQAVTPENFLAVLKGDSSKTQGGSGKVLKR